MESVEIAALRLIPGDTKQEDDDVLAYDVPDAELEAEPAVEDTGQRGKKNLKIDEINERVLLKKNFERLVAESGISTSTSKKERKLRQSMTHSFKSKRDKTPRQGGLSKRSNTSTKEGGSFKKPRADSATFLNTPAAINMDQEDSEIYMYRAQFGRKPSFDSSLLDLEREDRKSLPADVQKRIDLEERIQRLRYKQQ